MILARLLAAWATLVAAFLAAQVVVPQVAGPLALLQILAPYLAILAVGLGAASALLSQSRASAAALSITLLVAAARLGDEWLSLPRPHEDGVELRAMTWNLEVGSDRPSELLDPILAVERDIVALQELTPDAARLLEDDPRVRERFPFRVLAPRPGVSGLGLLSAYPVVEEDRRSTSMALHARLDVRGTLVDVVVAHPMPGTIRTGPRDVPLSFDGRDRDRRLGELRGWVGQVRATADGPVMLIGDLNVVPTEPGYALIADGFVDAHRAVGFGPGWTWRPGPLEGLGLGVIRIDYVLTSGPLEPRSTSTTCTVVSDHCVVDATFQLNGPRSGGPRTNVGSATASSASPSLGRLRRTSVKVERS